MGGIEGHVEERRFSVVLPEEPHCFAVKEVGAVGAPVLQGGCVVAIHGGNPVPLMGVIINSRIDEAVEVVESPRQRKEPLVDAEVPLAEDAAYVPGFSEDLWEEDFPSIHAPDTLECGLVFTGLVLVSVVRCLVSDHVIDSVALGIASGEDASSGGSAGGPAYVKICQLDAFLGQTVQMGGLDLLGAKAPQVR